MAIRQILLRSGLAVAYLVLVTPLKWAMRLVGWRPLAMQPDRSVASYWMPLHMDSSAKAMYETPEGSWTPRGILVLLGACRGLETGFVLPKQVIVLSMLPLKPFAAEPKESELWSDLYVMF